MKHQKLIALVLCWAVSVSVTACGSSNLESGSSSNSNPSLIIQESSSTSPTSASPNSKTVSSVTAEDSNTLSENSNSKKDESSSFLTQQDVFKQIRAALDTKVPLIIPTSIPVEKNRYLTATTVSQSENYEVSFYETAKTAKINSPLSSKGTLIATLNGRLYKDAASAKESISDYVQIDTADYDEFTDLGHKIKAVEQAGAGHQHLLWNEGRWYLHLDFPTDPTYRTKDFSDSKQLAKNIVSYLDKNMLPAPQKIGVINIKNWNTSEGTTVQWQDNQAVYQISGRDPMTVLKITVEMKSK